MSDNNLVTLSIDGEEVTVPKTKEAYDPLVKKKVEIPTTIYDAMLAILEKKKADKPGVPIDNPIPILCHREHINPVAVCRVCTVDFDPPQRVLAAACHRMVEPGMKVKTAVTSQRVRDSVRTITELLMADHPSPCEKQRQHGDCELEALAQRVGAAGLKRLPGPTRIKPHDDSSVVIDVDHSACILCDRCVRACNDIRDNQVIGRMAKGYKAQIAFDLNTPMGDSTCVACGECMVSCPTGALTNRTAVAVAPWKDAAPKPQPVSADDLARLPLFAGVSQPFLRWNEGAVVRRHFKKGDVICREGEFGSTAFLIEKGKVKVFLQSPIKHVKSQNSNKSRGAFNLFGLVQRFTSALVKRGEDDRPEESTTRYIHIDAPVSLEYSNPVATLEAGDIFGEMTCMNSYPRSATVTAEEDCTVLEMLRNVLYILQRNRASRAILDDRYRRRTIDTHLRSVSLFTRLLKDDAEFKRFVNYLRPRVNLLRLTPGEVVFRQGDLADAFYLIRIGFVKVSQNRPGGEEVLCYLGPGGYFGEIGLMSHILEVRDLAPQGKRVATCAALDHVDVVQIKAEDFRHILDEFPALRGPLVAEAVKHLKENEETEKQVEGQRLGQFLEQGLMNAQSLLVLDLQKCTRCDECTKACSDSHEGVTRLIREGLRFDKFLVASSCRSCLDPYCMVGCPVGSIRRRNSREIIIEDWCIGCGKCAQNCPYGNINMHPFDVQIPDPASPGRTVAAVKAKATMCDLCTGLDGQPSCVYACPHDAAHRMTGQELLEIVARDGR